MGDGAGVAEDQVAGTLVTGTTGTVAVLVHSVHWLPLDQVLGEAAGMLGAEDHPVISLLLGVMAAAVEGWDHSVVALAAVVATAVGGVAPQTGLDQASVGLSAAVVRVKRAKSARNIDCIVTTGAR